MNNPFWGRSSNPPFPLSPRTLIMGILNVTPDSFSDGGVWFDPPKAVAHAVEMLDQGADLIDVGGESTRPGAAAISPAEEQARVLPVIRELLRQRPDAVLSIDTYHAETATLAVEAGAKIVNDVSGGLWDTGMRAAWVALGCRVVLMHTRGRPQEWRTLPALAPTEIVPLVIRELRERVEEALAAGVAREAIALDPGFGFGKIQEDNWSLLAGLGELSRLGYPLVVGISRKGFLRKAAAALAAPKAVQPDEVSVSAASAPGEQALRDVTLAANTAAVLGGARILRVHDVPAGRRAAAVADQTLAANLETQG
jgi:dihydropteroate synthase